MNIICWNCRGAGGPRKKEFLNNLLQSTRAQIAFIIETKRSTQKSLLYSQNLFLPNLSCVPSQGRSGGLWLLWANNVNLQIIQKSRFFIHARITEPHKPPWTLIGVYGDPHHTLSNTIWQEIKKIVETDEKCCLLGDFNSVLNEQEKYGGSARLNSSSTLFRQFLFDTGLVDLGFRGPAYTWTNCQHTSTAIFQRLDRILVSSSWSQTFPHAYVNHLPRIHSDHAPLLLRTEHSSGVLYMVGYQQQQCCTQGYEGWIQSARDVTSKMNSLCTCFSSAQWRAQPGMRHLSLCRFKIYHLTSQKPSS